MAIFPLRRKGFFSAAENSRVIAAIQEAESLTSGEIRVYVESRCRFVDPLDRAAEIFWALKMDQTRDRNAVLIYVAMRDHQYALFADKGIYEKLGREFWEKEVREMGRHFTRHHYIDALIYVIRDLGEALRLHFPHDPDVHRNELPDEIIFGR